VPSPAAAALSSRIQLALAALILLAAINLFFHGFFAGHLRISGLICADAYDYFPGPLLHPEYRFTDYFDTQWFQPSRGQTSQLPPATILLYQGFHGLTLLTSPVISLLIYSLFQIGVFTASIARLLAFSTRTMARPVRLLLALMLTLCSYPVIFAIDRGHFALLLCALLNFAIAAHLRDKRWQAAVLIGFAAALRITPLLFVAVYLTRRDFRYLLAAVVTTLASWAISLAVLPLWLEGYDLEQWINGIADYTYAYSNWPGGLGWSSSLFNLVRYVRYEMGIPLDAILESANRAENLYALASLVVLGGIVLRVRLTQSVAAFALLTWAWVALPHITGDYYLAALIGPMVLLMAQGKADWLTLGLFVLLLTPKDYFYYYATVHKLFDFHVAGLADYHAILRRGFYPVSIQSLYINPLLLLVLGLRLVWQDLRSARACAAPTQ
jgi:hypothetical protein